MERHKAGRQTRHTHKAAHAGGQRVRSAPAGLRRQIEETVKAEQQRQYQEQAAAAAAERRAMWERTAQAEALEKSFS